MGHELPEGQCLHRPLTAERRTSQADPVQRLVFRLWSNCGRADSLQELQQPALQRQLHPLKLAAISRIKAAEQAQGQEKAGSADRSNRE